MSETREVRRRRVVLLVPFHHQRHLRETETELEFSLCLLKSTNAVVAYLKTFLGTLETFLLLSAWDSCIDPECSSAECDVLCSASVFLEHTAVRRERAGDGGEGGVTGLESQTIVTVSHSLTERPSFPLSFLEGVNSCH